jgi:hypothetical protein
MLADPPDCIEIAIRNRGVLRNGISRVGNQNRSIHRFSGLRIRAVSKGRGQLDLKSLWEL